MEPLNVSVEECARILGLGITFTKQLIRTGAILSYHEGRRRVVPLVAIREYQAERLEAARLERDAEIDRQVASLGRRNGRRKVQP